MNPSPAPHKNIPWLRLAGTILTVALLGYVLYQQGWSQILAALQRLSVWRLLLVLALTVLSRLSITLRWHILLRTAGEPVDFWQSLRLTFAGLFASNFLPTTIGGDVVRLAGAIQLRMDAAISTASLLMDRLVGMAGMVLALPWGIERLFAIGLPALLKPETSAVPLLAGVLPPKLRGLWDKALVFLRKTLQSVAIWLRSPAGLGLAGLTTLIHQLCLFSSIWLLLDGMNEPISWLWVAGIWSLVYFITLLPISINGYGLQEVSATLLFARLGGISPEASVSVALLVRTVQMIVSLPGAVFVPSIIAARQNTPKTPQDNG